MRVLIVDAFLGTPTGRQNLLEFKTLILKAFEAALCKTSCGDLAFAVRDKSKLHGFLYDSTTEFSDTSAMRSFNALDMIFIGSDDNNIVPWSKSVRQVSILLKNCIRNHKPTFATAFAMQMLASICMLEGEELKIRNGRGRGGPLLPNYSNAEPASLPRILEQLSQIDVELAVDEYFLDSGTGDLYGQTNKDWYFTGKNVGIYNPLFAPKKIDKNIGTYKSKTQIWETVKPVRVCEQYSELANPRFLQHWLLKGLPKQFILASRCAWHVASDMPPYFDVLLAGKSPLLIMFGPVCGFQSSISPKYPETIRILNNWTNTVMRKIMNNDTQALGYCIEVLNSSRAIPFAFERLQASGKSLGSEKKTEDENKDHFPKDHDYGAQGGETNGGEDVQVQHAEAILIGQTATKNDIDNRFGDLTKAFSRADKINYCGFSRREIRKFLHPNQKLKAEDEVKQVVYIGSRPGTRQKSRRNSSTSVDPFVKGPKLKPFLFAGKATTSLGFPDQVENFVTMTPGLFPCDHIFRETDKRKWSGDSRGFVPAVGGWDELPIAGDSASNRTLSRIPFRFRDRIDHARRNADRRPNTVPNLPIGMRSRTY